MANVNFNIPKATVLAEVRKTTEYVGKKMPSGGALPVGDESAYDTISATESDDTMLERFFVESCGLVTDVIKRFATAIQPQEYSATCKMPSNYDYTMTMSIEDNFISAVVNAILSKWFLMSNKTESDKYASNAAANLVEAKQKVYYRKSPVRVTT